MWVFGRHGRKATKFKDGQSPAQAASVALPRSDHGLRKTPSKRSTRKKRRSSGSTTSLRDPEKGTPLDVEKPRRSTSIEEITALPLSRRLEQSPHLRPIITTEHHIPYNFQSSTLSHSHSHSSLPRERRKLQRPQSLRNSGTGESSLFRRKSSRKRGHDSIREEEIRAMSMPVAQKRPAGHSSGMLRRDSKKVKGGLNRHFERPTSNISLPVEGSIHSSMSGSSETRAWRVSTLDMFTPRPKIRCSVSSPSYATGTRASPVSPLDGYGHEKGIDAERKRARRTSRIDDLADTLDAGALRQILERDKRRREKKKKAEDERMKRRLERRAEKQWEAEQRVAEQAGLLSPPQKQVARAVGLGVEKDTSEPMEDVRPSTPPQPHRPENIASGEKMEPTQLPTPMDSPIEEHVISDAKAIRYSRASMSPSPQSHTRGPSNVSELPALLSEMIAPEAIVESRPSIQASFQDPRASGSLHPVDTIDTTATSKRGLSRRRSSETGRMAAFASLFRRGKRGSRDQGRITPSEVSFSNTSRESMSRQPIPAHLVGTGPLPTQPIQIRRPSSVPRRTMSKFREDLPEYPMSPPDSRVQSLEISSTSAIAARRRSRPPSDLRLASPSPGADAPRTDSPVSPGVPPAGLMSQSLASVDSEGSWLSGKPLKRASNRSHMRSSVGSSSILKRNEEFNNSYEELGIPDDEYFKRFTPQPDDRRGSIQSSDMMGRKASSTAMAALDTATEMDEEVLPTAEKTTSEESLVKHDVGRRPTVVHRQGRVKSAEGLLSFYQPDKSSPEDEKTSPTPAADEVADSESPTSESEPVILQRAKSVDLGKHHSRQLSAGSARLLDIKRASADPKRASADPKRSSLSS